MSALWAWFHIDLHLSLLAGTAGRKGSGTGWVRDGDGVEFEFEVEVEVEQTPKGPKAVDVVVLKAG